MYKIVKVGIPIQTNDVTSEFLDIIDNIKTGNCIGITTVDYHDDISQNILGHTDSISSPAGHRVIFNNLKLNKYNNYFIPNSINTLGIVWDMAGSRDKHKLTQTLLNIIDKEYKKLKFDTVYIFSTGSPYFKDLFMETLPEYRKIDVVDTKSSFNVCVDTMYAMIGAKPELILRKYVSDFISQNDPHINLEKLNIFSCISNIYTCDINIPLVDHFFNTLNSIVDADATFLMVSVLENDIVSMKLKYHEAELIYKQQMEKNIPFIIGIYKGKL